MDSLWSSRHRAYVRTSVISVLVLILAVVLFTVWYKPPTCFDGKENQDELDVDCGGQCSLLCAEQVNDLTYKFAKQFKISEGLWSVAAYYENSNKVAYTREATYRFEFYDIDGKFIGERTGETYISSDDPGLVIIESKLDFGERTPYRVMFEWTNEPVWYRYEPVANIQVDEREVIRLSAGVEVRAWLKNDNPREVEDVEVALIVMDNNQNAIAVSTTYVEYVGPRSRVPISFSWPREYDKNTSRTEFHYRVKQPD